MENSSSILPELPAIDGKSFAATLPLYLKGNERKRYEASLQKLKLPANIVNGSFIGPSGDTAGPKRTYGFYFNGRVLIGPVVVPYVSGYAPGTDLYYANGSIIGNPLALPGGTLLVQYVGVQLSGNDIIVDIKEPYERLF